MSTRLPSKEDFVPYGTLDELRAWENFGGLSLDEAHDKLCENPLYYQEDFMWMGIQAFAFYFPAVDRFVRDWLAVANDETLGQLEIIVECISMQVSEEGHLLPITLTGDIRSLAETVIHKFGRCDGFDPSQLSPRQAFVIEWQHLLESLPSV